VPGSLEFAIHTLIETRLDMSVFDDNYQNDDTGRSAYNPRILLKVGLLAYSGVLYHRVRSNGLVVKMLPL
jgi:hypothetical protein